MQAIDQLLARLLQDCGSEEMNNLTAACHILITKHLAENAALKEQVVQLQESIEELTRKYQKHAGNYYASQDALAKLQSKSAALVVALEKIASWEMPSTGEFWDAEETRPVSFGTNYGSQGEQVHIRNVANKALAAFKEQS